MEAKDIHKEMLPIWAAITLVLMVKYMCTYKGYRDTVEIIAYCNTLEPDWPYQNHPTAQQYFPSVIMSLPFIPTTKD
jgi:hypothetical protein